MIIERIELTNFRSHEKYVLECTEGTSLILGPNGCGKTSVLEAIYEATRGKSFRAVDREIVRRGAGFYRVELFYGDGEKVGVVYEAGGSGGLSGSGGEVGGNGGGGAGVGAKSFLVGDKKWKRLPKKARYPVVLFLPDDLHLVGSSPSRKREYFDRILGELDEGYASALSRYNKALRQRNELLKSELVTGEAVFSWNIMLAQYGCLLRAKRAEFVAELNGRLTEVYRSIAENLDEVGLDYLYDSTSESAYLSRLEMDFQRDVVLGHTGYGAHRDNYEFLFNGVLADGSASRGEVRSTVLAMKFIEAELVFSRTGRRPVVLLDDVFSELDATRQACLVQNFRDNQVILTSVEGVGVGA